MMLTLRAVCVCERGKKKEKCSGGSLDYSRSPDKKKFVELNWIDISFVVVGEAHMQVSMCKQQQQ